MKKSANQKILSFFDDSIEIIYTIESVIELTKSACLNKELTSKYHNLTSNEIFFISKERNHYINMLSIVLDKVNHLKQINNEIEKELSLL